MSDSSEHVEKKFLNKYKCPECKHEWEDAWDSMCDDDCGKCGKRHISPHQSEDIPEADDAVVYDHEATYSPEDNKIRLYLAYKIGRDHFNKLREAGFVWTPKQNSSLSGVWTPDREDIALNLAGYIGDEDQPVAERAADRAERFAGYAGKRLDEATGKADAYDAGPKIHGNQNHARAESQARKHDRYASKAVNQWEKAEYWTSRIKSVIAHALHKDSPGVRQRRIKGLESDVRKFHKHEKERISKFNLWTKILALADTKPESFLTTAYVYSGRMSCIHMPKREGQQYADTAWGILERHKENRAKPDDLSVLDVVKNCVSAFDSQTWTKRWLHHYEMRLAYEKEMLAAQGGTADDKAGGEIQVGGRIQWRGAWLTVKKVNKGLTGTSSVKTVEDHGHWNQNIPVDRITGYQPPTVETVQAAKAAKKKILPLVNFKGEGFLEMKQEEYSHSLKNQYAGSDEIDGRYRQRSIMRGGSWKPVFLTDKPVVNPPEEQKTKITLKMPAEGAKRLQEKLKDGITPELAALGIVDIKVAL